jgi:hypothetical protein
VHDHDVPVPSAATVAFPLAAVRVEDEDVAGVAGSARKAHSLFEFAAQFSWMIGPPDNREAPWSDRHRPLSTETTWYVAPTVVRLRKVEASR